MRQAKAFFFVAAGILMLAGAFHLGAQSAQGQASNRVVIGELVSSDPMAIDEQGQLWGISEGVSFGPIQPPKPGTIVAVDGCLACTAKAPAFVVMYEDGAVFLNLNGVWSSQGNVFSNAPVQSDPTTWGRIKAERR